MRGNSIDDFVARIVVTQEEHVARRSRSSIMFPADEIAELIERVKARDDVAAGLVELVVA